MWGRHASAVDLLQIAYVCVAAKPYCRPPQLAIDVFESWVARSMRRSSDVDVSQRGVDVSERRRLPTACR